MQGRLGDNIVAHVIKEELRGFDFDRWARKGEKTPRRDARAQGTRGVRTTTTSCLSRPPAGVLRARLLEAAADDGPTTGSILAGAVFRAFVGHGRPEGYAPPVHSPKSHPVRILVQEGDRSEDPPEGAWPGAGREPGGDADGAGAPALEDGKLEDAANAVLGAQGVAEEALEHVGAVVEVAAAADALLGGKGAAALTKFLAEGKVGRAVVDVLTPLVSIAEKVPLLGPLATVAGMLLSAAESVSVAKESARDLSALVRKCVKVLEESAAVLPDHGEVLSALRDALAEGLELVETFRGRSWISKMYNGANDRESFVHLSGQLLENLQVLTAASAVRGARGVAKVQEDLAKLGEDLRRGALFEVDNQARLRRHVEERGGLEAVLGDEELRREVEGKLSTDTQVILREMRSAGPHAIIRNSDARRLWYSRLGQHHWVEAGVFLDALSDFLAIEKGLEDLADQIERSEGAARRLVESLDTDRTNTISTREMKMGFGVNQSFVGKIREILSSGEAVTYNSLPELPSSLLPAFRTGLVSAAVDALLGAPGAAHVHGPHGAGKTMLALAAAHEAVRRGACRGGAFYASLGGVASVEGALGKAASEIGAHLSGSPRASDVVPAIVSRVRSSQIGSLLLVLDSCGDVLASSDGLQFRQALGECVAGGLRVVTVGDDPWGDGARVADVCVPRLDPGEVKRHLRTLAGPGTGALVDGMVDGMGEGLTASSVGHMAKLLFAGRDGRMMGSASIPRGAEGEGAGGRGAPTRLGPVGAAVVVARADSAGADSTASSVGPEAAALSMLPEGAQRALGWLATFPAGFTEAEIGKCTAEAGAALLPHPAVEGALEVGVLRQDGHSGRFEVPQNVAWALWATMGEEEQGRARVFFLSCMADIIRAVTDVYDASVETARDLLDSEIGNLEFSLSLLYWIASSSVGPGPGDGERAASASLDRGRDPESIEGWLHGTVWQEQVAPGAIGSAALKESVLRLAVACADADPVLSDRISVERRGRAAQALRAWGEAEGGDDLSLGSLLAWAAGSLAQGGRHEEALGVLQQARVALESAGPPGDLGVCQILRAAARCNKALARYPEALEAFEETVRRLRGLGVDSKHARVALEAIWSARGDGGGGADHGAEASGTAPDGGGAPSGGRAPNELASVLHDLGVAMSEMHRPLEAEAVLSEALEMKRLLLPDPMHPSAVNTHNQLAEIWVARGEYDRALEWYRKALESTIASMQESHLTVALCQNNLGMVHGKKGNLAEAERAYEAALAIKREVLGDRHPSCAVTMGNIAGIMRLRGNLAGARRQYEEALAIKEAAHGPGHPGTVTTLSNLALVTRKMGEHGEALRLFRQVLDVRVGKFGAESKVVGLTLVNIGGTLREMGGPENLAGAREALERSVAIREKAWGTRDHIDVASSLAFLGRCLTDMGELEAGAAATGEALDTRRRRLPAGHPLVAASLHDEGVSRCARSDFPGAMAALEEALELRAAGLGERHADTATTRLWLALARVCGGGDPRAALAEAQGACGVLNRTVCEMLGRAASASAGGKPGPSAGALFTAVRWVAAAAAGSGEGGSEASSEADDDVEGDGVSPVAQGEAGVIAARALWAAGERTVAVEVLEGTLRALGDGAAAGEGPGGAVGADAVLWLGWMRAASGGEAERREGLAALRRAVAAHERALFSGSGHPRGVVARAVLGCALAGVVFDWAGGGERAGGRGGAGAEEGAEEGRALLRATREPLARVFGDGAGRVVRMIDSVLAPRTP